jgi:2-oxoisovalerate dehydrogenase E1 component
MNGVNLECAATFAIPYLQIIGEDGKINPKQSGLPELMSSSKLLIKMYRSMCLASVFDTKWVALQRTGRMGTYAPSAGQEAVGVGAAYAMEDDDILHPGYRDAAAQLVRGMPGGDIALFWAGDPRGSVMRCGNSSNDMHHMVPVGMQSFNAIGEALATQVLGNHRAILCIVGDGATSEGYFLEAINFAGAMKLPTVFVINNNQWAISMPRKEQCAAQTLAQKGIGAGIECMQVDGNDVCAMYFAVKQALDRARKQGLPLIVEALTYRITDHTTADDAGRYRHSAEVEEARSRVPIPRLRTFLIHQGMWNDTLEAEMLEEIQEEVDAETERYLAMAPESVGVQFDHVFANTPPSLIEQRKECIALVAEAEKKEAELQANNAKEDEAKQQRSAFVGKEIKGRGEGPNHIEAFRLAVAHEMRKDPTVVYLGEDVAVNGGVFRRTAGLLEEFGRMRVKDTPLAELGIAGLATGAALGGLRPVAEIQFPGFMYLCLDIMNAMASRERWRTQGQRFCPMVLTTVHGAGIHSPELHCECPEALFAHIPGLRVVIPSSSRMTYGLLLAAIRSNDPVAFFTPSRTRNDKEPVEDDGIALPLDKAFVLQQGKDITFYSWGAMLKETFEAAAVLENDGVSVEVIDVATVRPLDEETILKSFRKTGRAVIVHEAPRSGGIGAEISALIVEHAVDSIAGPIQRVTGWDTPPFLARYEKHYIPSVDRIVSAAHKALAV